MAKSKRSKVVHLTRTDKKGRKQKETLIDTIRTSSTQYKNIYLFNVQNMRNIFFKTIRNQVEGRFFIGKNKVMALALGLTRESECVEGAAKVSAALKGDVGMLFSNLDRDSLQRQLDSLVELDFARTGNPADETIAIKADPTGLKNQDTLENLPATCEPQLRSAGLPTKLVGGTIILEKDEFVICEQGKLLTSDQSRLLKMLGFKMATFRVEIISQLCDGEYEEFTKK